ncbi:hypothetical protein [Streptomyces sp. E1N211]|uniref:hypothetical protein n=1 Tax=Streptomyces sp. E1N211 TaxID=1851876 RepID=UPI0012D9FC52|nr:hypothetical protein [Streptomyces sp. E1N211]
MTNDPRGRPDGREPMATAEQLNNAIAALGIKMGDGPQMPRAMALGALLFCVEQLAMFDVDRVDTAQVRAGYVNMALMAGMAMEGEQMPAGTVMPGREVTPELWEAASFAIARVIEHRLNSTLLDMEEMEGPKEPDAFNVAWPAMAWLRAVCAMAPLMNADVPNAEILKAAKAAKKHAAEGRQHLADLIKLASKGT